MVLEILERATIGWGGRRGRVPTRATSAPGLGAPVPHLHRDWAHPCHICTGTWLAHATSAPGLGPTLPHLHRDWATSAPATGVTPATSAPGLAHRCHICTGTWPARSTVSPRLSEAADLVGFARRQPDAASAGASDHGGDAPGARQRDVVQLVRARACARLVWVRSCVRLLSGDGDGALCVGSGDAPQCDSIQHATRTLAASTTRARTIRAVRAGMRRTRTSQRSPCVRRRRRAPTTTCSGASTTRCTTRSPRRCSTGW